MQNLKGQAAIVTGATSGIGLAVAKILVVQGMRVYAVGKDIHKLEKLVQEMGEQVKITLCDLDNEHDILQLTAKIKEESIAVLVHSAGIFIPGLTENLSLEHFDLQYRVNLRAPFLLTQILLPMLKKQQGQIVFVNSSVSLQATKANVGVYAGTKIALKAFADSLRDEVNGYGVRVISVYPGRTASAMQAAIHNIEGKEYRPELLLQPEDIAQAIVDALLASPTAEITDISIRPFLKA